MLEHTDRIPDLRTVILGLSLELWLVDGELSGALWLFCGRYLCDAGVGTA